MTDRALDVEIESMDSATIVAPQGDVDLSKSSDLRSALRPVLASKPKRIVVDLSAVPYMDSAGVATLIEALQIAKRTNIFFVLCCLTSGVQSIIELTRLDQIFLICKSREDALGA